MRSILLLATVLLAGTAFGQRTKSNTAKMDFTQYPTVPVEGMKTLGIQVYTANLPFNKDTLRLYLGNMDIMKSNVERMSKVDYQALNEVTVVGGEGDITIDMAIGEPMVVSKEQKTSSCMVAKDGCTQYYYIVKYRMPALVQARNSDGVVDTRELPAEMELQFGNEQIETHQNTDVGSSTSIRVVNYTSEVDLQMAFNELGAASLARKGIVNHIGNMAESIYRHVFFEETRMKLDIGYGQGKAADYLETETASVNAVGALESKNYALLADPIKTWESWLERYDPNDRKAAVNDKVAQALYENLSVGYTFTDYYDKARTNLDKALEIAQSGMVNTNEVNRLKEFHVFIDDREKAMKYNGDLNPTKFETAPDIKKLLGRRKFNADIDFLIPEDKYSEIAKKHGETAPKKDISEMTVEEFLSQQADGESGASADDEEISLEGRVENNMLILSGLVDANMSGKPMPASLCEYTDIKTIRARNIGLTSLPDCISELTQLEKLYVNSNAFETLPDAFGSMKNLEVLDISSNNLPSIPESIYTLTSLKKIFVSGNNFSAEEMKRLEDALPDCKIK